jgi:Kae1-associated kinase Bud32
MFNKKGAEAVVILDFENKIVVKERISKSYRIKEFDEYVRKKRTKKEAKILKKLENVINVPKVLEVKDFTIKMELINGKTLKEIKDLEGLDNEIIKKMAELVSKLHDKGIIHGDLTLKNFILKEQELYLIDFGLAYFSDHIEDKATDLVVLKDVLSLEGKKDLFDLFLENYKQKDKEKIVKRIEEIEERGRYKKKQKV